MAASAGEARRTQTATPQPKPGRVVSINDRVTPACACSDQATKAVPAGWKPDRGAHTRGRDLPRPVSFPLRGLSFIYTLFTVTDN
jgi:hypothetical protein